MSVAPGSIVMYTDGSSRGNPGPGGYGTVLMSGQHKKELSQGYKLTTNNRMELMAVIAGLEALKKPGFKVTVYSDSQYVVKAVSLGWLQKWIATGFKGGKKNKDLWMRYYALASNFHVNFIWVKGHADNIYNNRCDQLANRAADSRDLLDDVGYIQESNSNMTL
jgi:ribonuclease HI